MPRRFTSGLTAAVLLRTLVGGVAFARGAGGECMMPGMSGKHACCKRARTQRRSAVKFFAVSGHISNLKLPDFYNSPLSSRG